MKFIIVLATVACVLSATLATTHHKVEKAHSEVMSYVHENMGNVVMMRGNSNHLVCYNGFLPLINRLATKARDVSNKCVEDATNKKDTELSGLKNKRTEIAAEVEKIKKSLNDCSEQDGLDYFKCLEENAETNRQLMEEIKTKSRDLVSEYGARAAAIDRDEATCLMDAVDNAKAESDQAFADLKTCIRDGPQPSNVPQQPVVDEDNNDNDNENENE